MLATDFYDWVLPSFVQRAHARLGQLSLLLVSMQFTEPWDSTQTQTLLEDAQLLRHGLASLTTAGNGLELDEQRYVVERLLPLIGHSLTGPIQELEPPFDLSVPVHLSLSPTSAAVNTRTTTGYMTPAGSTLLLLRDGKEINSQPVAQSGTFRSQFADVTPGGVYTAQLYYQGRLLGEDTKALNKIYWAAIPLNTTVPTYESAYLSAEISTEFVVAEGRSNLVYLLPADKQWKVVDPRVGNLDISAAFFSESITFNKEPMQILRQLRPVIGPSTFSLILQIL